MFGIDFDAITRALSNLTRTASEITRTGSEIVSYFTISPFWLEWLPLGIGIIALATAMAWFFPSIRGFAGAVVLATITFLVGFRKGEDASAKRYQERLDSLRRNNRQQQQQVSPQNRPQNRGIPSWPRD